MKMLSNEAEQKIKTEIVQKFHQKMDDSFAAVEEACKTSNPEHVKSVRSAYTHAKMMLALALHETEF